MGTKADRRLLSEVYEELRQEKQAENPPAEED